MNTSTAINKSQPCCNTFVTSILYSKVKKQMLLFLTFLVFSVFAVAQTQSGGCPDHNTNTCAGQQVDVNVDSLPFCDEGGANIEGDITNNGGNPSSCLDENGDACFEFRFFRAVGSATQSFTFDVGQGQGCTGQLDAYTSLRDH